MLALTGHFISAQQAWFIDGYHGGKWGHYPPGYTAFIVEQLKKNPNWKINLEIEPETWEMVKHTEPAAYSELVSMYAAGAGNIDFVNPAYGQPYFYNISGESIIRQFTYGINKTRKHFPTATFTSYSSEEPCFTSALPQVLKSFGFQYASLKNPNTCWGGYTRAYGGELVKWIGPDGTSILTSPRYAIESLVPNTTWQNIAWLYDRNYILQAARYGIKHPIGMTLQDAGWKNGPWLKSQPGRKITSDYTTWTNYFKNIADQSIAPGWKLSQEDVLVSLVWGSQVLQRIAQQVRKAENRILQAEKMAAMSTVFGNSKWPGSLLDTAWTRLLLAQHHDCWIVPYNGKPGDTWVDKVRNWTSVTVALSDSIIGDATRVVSNPQNPVRVRVFNTTSQDVYAPVFIPTEDTLTYYSVMDHAGNAFPIQRMVNDTGVSGILFLGRLPMAGYADFELSANRPKTKKTCSVEVIANGKWKLESDIYTLIIDPGVGGVIKSLISKKDNREWVDKKDARSFNEIRGRFYKLQKYLSSTDQPAKIEMIENGPLRVRVKIEGMIGDSPFQQMITLIAGQQRIDMSLHIDWQGSPGIGNDYQQDHAVKAEVYRKAFYDDRDKLLISFPVALENQKIYKNAPFDVTESKLKKTWFTTWDSIENNVLLNWVDVTDGKGKNGLAVYSDHTGNYLHAKDLPLGLTVQYAGEGLWGMNYRIKGATDLRYAILPHKSTWNQGDVEQQRQIWNEPVIVTPAAVEGKLESRQLVKVSNDGWELVTMLRDGNDLVLRMYNAAADNTPCKLFVQTATNEIVMEELDGTLINRLKMTKENKGTSVIIKAPLFSIRTIRLKNIASN